MDDTTPKVDTPQRTLASKRTRAEVGEPAKRDHHIAEVRFSEGAVLTRASAINLARGGVPALDNDDAVDAFMLRVMANVQGAAVESDNG